MHRSSFIHPFAFTLTALIFLYLRAEISVPPTELVLPVLLMWTGLFLLIWPAYWLTRNWEWAPILLTIFVLGFYSLPQVSFWLGLAAVSMAVAYWGALSWLRKRRASIQNVNFALNVTSVAGLLLALCILILQFSATPALYLRKALLSTAEPTIVIPQGRDAKPDVYYFLLDGYARADVLQELYGYDNSGFVDYLRSLGFIVPSGNHSNYPRTVLSIASTLNMDYTSQLVPGLDHSAFWWLLEPSIQHSQVRTMLESLGYNTVSIYTDWDVTNIRSADQFLQPRPVTESDFGFLLLNKTPLGILRPLIRTFAFDRTFAAHRDLVNYQFDTMAQSPSLPSPKFVFVHIISPHPPFVFDGAGNTLTPPGAYQSLDASDFRGSAAEYREGYTGQVQFVNSRLRQTIESILQNSQTPPIIILQADHGSGLLTNWSSLADTCVMERFSPFAAYYLPGLPAHDIPEDITPVNLFRIIFNHYFGTDLPLLENRSFFTSDPIHIFDQVDVSTQLDTPCAAEP